MADLDGGTVEVTLTVNDKLSSGLDKATKRLATAQKKMQGFSDRAARVGKSMTMGVTAPIVAAGGAAFKMASDFERSMTQIQSLVGRSASEVQKLEKDVLALSGKTARAPQELAEAMFFLTSAGLDAEGATAALEASAKAAAAGLGSTVTVADAVTNAINGYGAANMTASRATDVLAKTVEQGKASAESLAPQFGRLIPMAAELGIQFEDVGAGLAFLTRASGSAEQASVALRGVMSKLIKPSQQGVKELEKMGMSMEDLRAVVEDDGLLAALDMLKTAQDENGFKMEKFFEDVEGLNGVLQLTGPAAADAAAIFDELGNAAGKTEEIFAVVAQTTDHKMNQAIADFKAAMITLGEQVIPVVLPIIEKFAGFIGRLAESFGNLSPGMQKAIVIIGGVVAAVGPALIVMASLVKAIGTLKTALMGAHPALLLVGAAVATVGYIMAKRASDAANFQKEVDKAKETLIKINPELEGVTHRLQTLADTLPEAADPMQELAAATEEFSTEALFAAKASDQKLYKSFQKLRDAGVEFDKVLESDIAHLDDFITELDRGNGITNAAMHEIKDMSKEGRNLARELADLHDAEEITIKDMRNLLDGVEEVNESLAEAQKQSRETAQEFLDSNDTYKIITQSLGYAGAAADDFHQNLKDIADDKGPREALRYLEEQVEEVAMANEYAATEFANFREEAKATAIQAEQVAQTWEQLKDIADQRALYFTLALDTSGLYEQLNEAMNAIIDVGSLMPGGDSTALETQLAITRRISAKLVDTKGGDRKAVSTAASAAAREFEQFFNSAMGLGDHALSDSFAEAIVGSPEDIEKAFAKLFDKAFDDGLTNIPGLRATLSKALEAKNGLIALAEQRIGLTNMLAKAEDDLAKAIGRQETAQARVNSLMNARTSMATKTASAFGFTFGETPGAKGRAQQLLQQYTAFHLNLTKLRDRGFPVDIISQVIGLGAFAGNQTAQELLAMGDTDFTEFLGSLTGISAIGQAIGNLQAGMMFDASISGAQGSLASAQSDVFMAQNRVTMVGDQLAAVGPEMAALAKAMRMDFGNGIADLVRSMDPLPDKLQQVFNIFLADIQAIMLGESKGITALGTAATGSIPRLLAAAASKSISGVTSGGTPPGSKTNPIAVTPIAAPSAAMSALIDAGSLETMRRMEDRSFMRTKGAGFAFADAGSMGLLGSGRGAQVGVDALPGGVVINVQGSIVTEREIREVIRQGALEDQRSGKSWSVDVL
jgi:TP901 family phage tail tape measure protein